MGEAFRAWCATNPSDTFTAAAAEDHIAVTCREGDDWAGCTTVLGADDVLAFRDWLTRWIDTTPEEPGR